MNASRELVFVYGTLRRGGSQHHRMRGAQFVATGTAPGRIHRIDWYPALVPDPDGRRVTGEIHAVDASLLAALDEFEGVATDNGRTGEYRRVITSVETSAGPRQAWVWQWNGRADDFPLIASGDWLAETADQPAPTTPADAT